ncbi:NUDIX domain-containing protein [Streptomyces sp. FIT100]|nr:NUDIX domain-containing protein [Streptomyces sp. FIT100]
MLVEPNYREGWTLPGGTIESDAGETPREAARRETLEELEEIGLDVAPGRLLAVDPGLSFGSGWISERPAAERLMSQRCVQMQGGGGNRRGGGHLPCPEGYGEVDDR